MADLIMKLIVSLFSMIDSWIYCLIKLSIVLIFDLADYQFFKEEFFADFANRIYIILGVLMLFKVVISFIQMFINPDKTTDKENGLGGLLKRTIITVALLAIIPSIFTFAISIQQPISKAIPKIILNTTVSDEAEVYIGGKMAYQVWSTFVDVKPGKGGSIAGKYSNGKIMTDGEINSLETLYDKVNTQFDKYSYQLIIPTIVGAFLLYILVSMAIDIAIRCFKLGVLQLLAPLAIASYIDPKTAKNTFDVWVKNCIKVYSDLFVRLAVIYLIIFIFDTILSGTSLSGIYEYFNAKPAGNVRATFVIIFIIIGLLFFAKKAPGFIMDILGVKQNDDLKDMFSPKRFISSAAAAINPFRNAIGNAKYDYKNTSNTGLSKAKRILSASKRAAGGFTKSSLNGVKGITDHKGWKDQQADLDRSFAASKKRSNRAAHHQLHNIEENLTEEQKQKLNDLKAKTLGYTNSTRDEADLNLRANNSYNIDLNEKQKKLENLQTQINSGRLSQSEIIAKGKEISNLSGEIKDMQYNKDKYIAKNKQFERVKDAYNNELTNMQQKSNNFANRIKEIDDIMANGTVTNEQKASLIAERTNLVVNKTKLDSDYNNMKENENNNIAKRNIEVNEMNREIDKIVYIQEHPQFTTINRRDEFVSNVDKFFGGSGTTGKDYISVADILKNNRSSLWSGEAMTKLQQNPEILSKSGGNSSFVSNIDGKLYNYENILNLKIKVDNGTLTSTELSSAGFQNESQIKAVFTDIEKSAASEYINLANNGKIANTTITEAIKRMLAAIDGSNITAEEKKQMLAELSNNPGKFLKSASDLQEKFRTKGSRISAYNSGEKVDK